MVERRDGQSGPSLGKSPTDVSLPNLADALGMLEYPPKDFQELYRRRGGSPRRRFCVGIARAKRRNDLKLHYFAVLAGTLARPMANRQTAKVT